MKKVYLAGPINSCTDEEVHGWRDKAKELLTGFECVDPSDWDCRQTATVYFKEIVARDFDLIRGCQFVLVNCYKGGWGTPMEVLYSNQIGVPVFGFSAPNTPSPWLLNFVNELYVDLGAACLALKEKNR
jgi:hypothetical protein